MADLGNISGAKGSLGPRPPPVAQTDLNKATIADLHPRRLEPLPPDLSGLLHGCPTLHVTPADVQAALRRSGSGKAPGPTGLTNDHIKQLVGYGEKVDLPMLHALTGFINLFLSGGYAGVPAADWLSSASFHSFVKTKADGTPQAPRPSGGDPLRPLGINDTWTNVACRSAMTDDMRNRLRQFFEQLGQFGVGTPAGCPAVVLAVQAWLTDPDNAVFQSDLVNAFNSFDRVVALRTVRKYFPELYPAMYTLFARDNLLQWGSRKPGANPVHVFTSEMGSVQGGVWQAAASYTCPACPCQPP